MARAFVPPQPMLASSSFIDVPCLTNSRILQESVTEICVSYEAVRSTLLTSEGVQTAGGPAPYILLAAAVAVPLFAIAKFTYSSYIIPKAAEQLETETKELAPKLWNEVKEEFEDGQILEQRPDLMGQLFKKIQPYLLKELAEQMEEDMGLRSEEIPISDSSEGDTKED